MHKEAREELRVRVRLKLIVLELAKHFGVTKASKEFNVLILPFYRWKQKYEREGRSGLYAKESNAHTDPPKTSPEVIEKIRTDPQLGALRMRIRSFQNN